MSTLEILTTPNPLLYQKATELVTPDEVIELIKDMKETIANVGYKGLGSLAAPQVGLSKKLFVIMLPGEEPLVVLNPNVKRQFGGQAKMWELCFSIPGKVGRVKRYKKIAVEYTDEVGEIVNVELDGLMARTFLHEYDHLEGVLWTDLVENEEEIMSIEDYFSMRKKASEPKP